MLRLAQSTPGLSQGLIIARNRASLLRSGLQPKQQLVRTLGAQGSHGDATHAAVDRRRAGSNRSNSYTSTSTSTSNNSSTNGRLAAAFVLRPSALFSAGPSKMRYMSTSAAAGRGAATPDDFAESQAGTDAAAQSAAAAGAAGDLGGQGAAVASAGDAAMAAAEAADTVRFGLRSAFELLFDVPPAHSGVYVKQCANRSFSSTNLDIVSVVVDGFDRRASTSTSNAVLCSTALYLGLGSSMQCFGRGTGDESKRIWLYAMGFSSKCVRNSPFC